MEIIFLKPSGLLLRTSLNSLLGIFTILLICVYCIENAAVLTRRCKALYSVPRTQGSWGWWHTIIISVERLRQKEQVLGRPGVRSKTLLKNNRKGW
jgi:hypothetical protein